MNFVLPSMLSALLVLGQISAEDSNRKENTTLLLVQALIRHGERAPLFLYPNDPNKQDLWPGGLDKLTRMGKHHHYLIGKYLRSKYQNFLTANPKEVLVNSSCEDRCLRGAEVTATALYQPEGFWKFEDDLNWQPIPVYFLPMEEDKFLHYGSDCPRAFGETMRVRDSEEIQELARKHQKMLEEVSNYTEIDISKEFNAIFLYDTLSVEKMYNLTIPTLLDNYLDEIQEFGDTLFKCFYGSDLILRLRVGPFLQDLSETMEKKINRNDPDLKVQLYFTQDVNVAAVLVALNFTDMPRPPNCATLLFELHQMADTTVAVRLLYMNSTDLPSEKSEPQVLILDNCTEFCPWENFTKKFRHLIPDDWSQECQSSSSKIDNSFKILIIVFSVVVGFALISLVLVFIYSKKSIEKQEGKSVRKVAVSMAKNVP